MKNKCKTISFAIFLTAIFLFGNGHAAVVTKINDIRSGRHKGFTRLVVDAVGARPLKIGPAAADGVIIVYNQLKLTESSDELYRTMRGAVARVSHHRQGDRSVIRIHFRNPNNVVKSFYLGKKSKEKGAYRLILDLYPAGSAAAGPGSLVPVESTRSVMSVPAPAPAPAAALTPTAAVETAKIPLSAAESTGQLKKTLPTVLKAEPGPQSMRVKNAWGGGYQGSHHAEPPDTLGPEIKKENSSNPSLPEKAVRVSAMEQPMKQPAIRNEYRGIGDTSSAGLITDVPIVSKPTRILTVQSPPSDLKKATPRLAESLPGNDPKSRHVSIGIVEITLKLLSIALSCLVIFFLHKANKMATARYDGVLELKNLVKPQPSS